jgi:ABC-type oligopeptide transport system ATPase subunit
MKIVGKVRNISIGQDSSASALIPRQGEGPGLVLGQFVLLGKIKNERMILARVIEIQPDFNDGNLSEALKQALSNGVEIDEMYHDSNSLFLGAKLKLLGVCEIGADQSVSFYSDVRKFPPIQELDVLEPSYEIMMALMYNAVRMTGDGAEVIEFQIGELAYGSDPENTAAYSGDQAVPVYINVRNLLRRRTGIVGKSGYGKSNLVKCVVGMLAKEAKNAGQLLIDTNGEYSLDNSQNDGFLDIFLEAGMPEKVVVYTNRNLTENVKRKYEKNLRPLRIDAYAEPTTVFTIVAESVRRQIKNDELPKYLIKWVNGAETDEDKNAWDSVTKKGTVRAMYYAALSNEGIKPTSAGKKCEVGTEIDAAYITKLLVGEIDEADLQDGEEPAEPLKANDMPKAEWHRLTDEYHIINSRGKYFTNHIETMIGYGRWFAENKASSDNELKDFKDLVLEKSYRLSSIKKLHVGNSGGDITQGLSSSVFKSLKEGKIVILDLALESIRVSDVLTRHILNNIFSKMSEDFGRTEIRQEFSKRDIVVYIEEAQNYLSDKSMGDGSIYERIVKEGRKFNIGVVYVTQQPSAISTSITSQTENIFALHMSNERDTQVLHSIKDKYDPLTCRFIKDEAAKGLVYIYSEPYQSFVIPAKVRLFNKDFILGTKKSKKK